MTRNIDRSRRKRPVLTNHDSSQRRGNTTAAKAAVRKPADTAALKQLAHYAASQNIAQPEAAGCPKTLP
jgi:hypothetical protein